MGFFHAPAKAKKSQVGGISIETLHRAGCEVCPLNHLPGNKHPHMRPSGTDRPLIYMLGEAPGETEDRLDDHFVGNAGDVLRFRIPEQWLPDLRWNNTVRTRPPQNRDPSQVEIECCRPSIVRDIEEAKPSAIFGFGNIALNWALRRHNITQWAGRRIPVKIETHTCWYFPFLHPSAIAHMRRWEPRRLDEYGCDDEFAFAKHLESAFAAVDAGLPTPRVWTKEEVYQHVSWTDGHGADDVDYVLQFIKDCYEEPFTGLDYETGKSNGESCLRPYEDGAKILTVGLAREDAATAWAMDHDGAGWTKAGRKEVDRAFREFLYEASTRKISFQLCFEMEWSAFFYGKECLRAGKWGDAQSQAYILDERADKGAGGPSLDATVLEYFGFDLKALSNVDRKHLAAEPIENVLPYNALDAKFHRLLWFPQAERLEAEGLEEVYQEQERRCATVVLSQLQGVPIDQDTANDFADEYEAKREAVEQKIDADPDAKRFKKRFGHHYNPAAQRDVDNLFRKILGFHMDNATEAALAEVDHPLAQLTVDWRKAHKVLSTYIWPCIEGMKQSNIYADGLLHYILSICKVRTWRTSSEAPNIQNYPKRNEELKEVRRMVAVLLDLLKAERRRQWEALFGEDPQIVSFDYAGIQARNVAMESLDQTLIDAFWDRYDIHTDWMEAAQKLHPRWADPKKLVHDKDYRKSFRHKAKNKFVFPSFFGAQPKSIAPQLGVPERVAEEMHEAFFDRFHDIKQWQLDLQASYYQQGYVTGLSGFRRRAPVEWNQIINTPIQSDEAIIVCDAYSTLSETGDPHLQAMMEIHDDLTFIWPKKKIERLAEQVIDTMVDVPYKWAHVVPIEVEMSVGPTWADLEEIGAYASDTWKGNLLNDPATKVDKFRKLTR